MSEDLDECARRLLAVDVEHHQDCFNDAYAGGSYSVSWADVAYETLRGAGAAAIPPLVRRLVVAQRDDELDAIAKLIHELPIGDHADAMGLLVVPRIATLPHAALDMIAWSVAPKLLADARREVATRMLERAAIGDHTTRLAQNVARSPALRGALEPEDIPPSLRSHFER